MSFLQILLDATRRNGSLLCVGLDPEPDRIPSELRAEPDPIYAFCAAIVEATADLVCAFKPNIAFFEALGPSGISTLQRVIAAVPRDIPVILDAKRGDIGSTATAYAHAIFDVLGASAVTLNPYLGGDSLAPFLRYAEKGCLILCKTSNPGSADVQDLQIAGGGPLYLEIARRTRDSWNAHGNAGLVVGATHPDVFPAIRSLCPDLPLLVPGVGAQGGELGPAVHGAVDARGERAIITVSRAVLYAAADNSFADAARRAATQLREEINRFVDAKRG